jgi:kynurenine formamidase
LAAASLIQTGTIYDMGRVFEEEMPLFSLTPKPRKYSLTIPGAPSWGPLGENKLLWNEDYIAGHLSQNGIYAIENLDFDRFIEAKGYEFGFVVGTLPLKGATGSPVRPFAIK